eukprot:TRINITY_DN10164_c0_g1_i3.p1 TRINITY_DN10164_c0_g1~~TRINITY_DN10164_c0_g1_i3.p1  ORF type:complete len:392 (-),score=87.77 TRINITY_DN10164_c0_g1_i3:22-1197(-)
MSDPAEAEEDTEPAEPQQKRQRTEQQPCEVGLVFDTRMTLHAREPGGPAPFKLKTGEALEEAPERILRVRRGLELAGLIERCTMVPSREVTMHEACAVHSQEHWNDVEALPSLSAEDRCKRTEEADTVYFNQHTSLAARLAAGSTLELCSNIAMGSMLRGFAIVRPPGHHAEHSQCRGFCLLNNVAIAAKFALTRQSVNRVLILDFDVHHGQATQQSFEDSAEVLYISIHRHDGGRFYPCGKAGGHTKVGVGAGKGYNVNIPWNGSGMGDADYMFAMKQVVNPIAAAFKPDLVLISAGFDAAKGDPFGQCSVTPAGYAHMVRMMVAVCPRVLCVLEGGYNLDSIQVSSTACVRALFDSEPAPELDLSQLVHPSAVTAVQLVQRAHSKYWAL